MTLSGKPTNPKSAVAIAKLPLHLVPDTLAVYAALAFAEGAAKYGAYNWREAGAAASVYVAALRRHLAKWMAGEELDAVSGVPHLASALACIGIILDARAAGVLVDDRPPPIPGFSASIDAMEADVRRVLDLFSLPAGGGFCAVSDPPPTVLPAKSLK